MAIRSLENVKNLKGKHVLLRVDFNVPVKGGKVVEDTRLKASLPTIQYLRDKGAKVIIVTHLGRPEGKRMAALSVKPVAKHLETMLDCQIIVLPRWSGIPVEKQIAAIKSGDVVMLENIRFSPEESKDKGTLSQELAGLADVFVLDGFAVAHRGDASVSGVARFIPAYAGLLLGQEIKGLERVTKRPKHPFIVVIGGAKMETKIPVIKNLLPKADNILVGGGIANSYLQAAGYGIGDSLVDEEFEAEALAYASKRKVVMPVDVVVGDNKGKKYRVVEIRNSKFEIRKKTKNGNFKICNHGEAIYDIGPMTIRMYADYIKKSQTLVWNGAMGYFEQKPYDVGTFAIARLVASRSKGKAFGVIGGGETLQAMDMVGMSEYVDLVSTGGGAMLEYLAGNKLPGVEAVMSRRSGKN